MFENMTLISGKLGEVFPLEVAVPLWVNQAPTVPKGVPGTFSTIHAPEVVAQMLSFTVEVSHLQKKEMGLITQEALRWEQHDSETSIVLAEESLQTPVTMDRAVLIQST